ncbi:MAG: hypothetical protein KatS3mg061_3174 [Dehalococcoidia bacterium]|nr:MAG: hypothetical protein KatS3mg061_3174 [Dehalococcoidia bacterium]
MARWSWQHGFFRLLAAVVIVLLGSPGVPPAAGQATLLLPIGVIYARDPNAPASTRQAAMETAAQRLNRYFQSLGSPLRVQLVLRETGRDRERTLAAVRELYDQGIRVFIGPETSAEVQAVDQLPFAREIVVISYASTAPSLMAQAVSLFRVVPNDTNQAQALATLLWEDGIRAIVPVWRDDIYGRDLARELRARFTAFGGSVADGILYPTTTTEFGPVMRVVGQQVGQHVALWGKEAVAVVLIAIDETPALLRAAAATPLLDTVWWYGTDGTALNLGVLRDPVAAAFAWQTAFTASLYGEEVYTQEALDLGEAIRQQTGMAPEAYAYTAYDAVMVAGLTAERAGGVNNAARFAAALPEVANGYFGVTGPMVLDRRGDRAFGTYEFWAVRAEGDELFWVDVAHVEILPDQAPYTDRFLPHRRPRLPIALPLPLPLGR